MKKTVLFLMIMTRLSICTCSPIDNPTPETNKYSFEIPTRSTDNNRDEYMKQFFLKHANNTVQSVKKHPKKAFCGSVFLIAGITNIKTTQVLAQAFPKTKFEMDLYTGCFIAIGSYVM